MADHADSSEGPYRIATVAELTGVPEPTLRAWERRYGIPSPDRTASGYRLYGAFEVEEVREMRRLCDGGMAASDAARVLTKRRAGRAPAKSAELAASPFDTASSAILDAIERFDDDALELELRRLTLTGSADELFDRVLAPTLRVIGDKWHAGELSVAQEHFASQRIGALMRDLLRLAPGAGAGERVVLASFADDEHDLGLLGAAIRFTSLGLRPVFLGARTPPAAVRSAVRATRPKLVGLSVTIAPTRVRARELLEEYGAACGDVPWMVGGGGVDRIADLVEKLGGVVAPSEPAQFRTTMRRVLGRARGGRR